MLSLFINQMPHCARAVVLRDGRLVRYLVLGAQDEHPIGTIFLGRVQTVNSAIAAAFIDLGQGQQAFLNLKEGPVVVVEGTKFSRQANLKEGQGVLVQLQKPPLRDKLAAVGAELKFVGFRCIFMPFGEGIRFSRDFKGDQELCRQSLLALQAERGLSCGWLVRSQAGEGELSLLEVDARGLIADWTAVGAQLGEGKCRPLWREDRLLHLLRDGSKEGWRSLICDDPSLFESLKQVLVQRNPTLLLALKQHDIDTPLFDTYRIEEELSQLEDGHVWLKSGGSLEIHQTEAMVTIDVNSGKASTSTKNQSAGMRTNLEAATEVGRQIIARNLAGLILVDFINVRDEGWTRKVEGALRAALASDTVNSELLPINKFGVAMIARQRLDRDHNHVHNEACPRCQGRGWIKQLNTLALEVQRKLARAAAGMAGETFLVRAGRELAEYLSEHHALLFESLQREHNVTIRVIGNKKGGRSFAVELQ